MKALTPQALADEAAERRRHSNYDALRTHTHAERTSLTRDEQAVLGPVVEQLHQLLAEGHTVDTAIVTRTLLARRRELNAVIAATSDDELRELLVQRAATRARGTV